MPAKKKSAIQELSEFVRDHVATKDDIRDLKGSIIRLSKQVTSIEGDIRGMKRAKL
jgi:polyhydroxyalkanoate synthesis regulator phasin